MSKKHDDMRDVLIAEFNGAIKYEPMLLDHGPDAPERRRWTKAACAAHARENHAKAIEGLRRVLRLEAEGHGPWNRQIPPWNNKIPYCRNLPTEAMLAEARATPLPMRVGKTGD